MTHKEFDRLVKFLKIHKNHRSAHFFMTFQDHDKRTRSASCAFEDVRIEGDGIYTSKGQGKTYTPRKMVKKILLWVQPYEGNTVYF